MRSDARRRLGWKPARGFIGEESRGDSVRWLIDNSEAYTALLAAIGEARDSISISQLAFEDDCVAFDPADDIDTRGENLFDSILIACERQRVRVRILLNSSILVNTRRTLSRVVAARRIEADLLEIRGLSRFPQLLHAKVVIIDGHLAFLMGSPFVNGYWDSPTHSPFDPRRPSGELGGRPIHDVSVEVRGRVVADLTESFDHLWLGARREVPSQTTPPRQARRVSRATGNAIRVVTTEPRGFVERGSPGSTETLKALLSGIARARSLVYIEHQYLSSRPVVETLRNALDREPSLEIVMLLNQNPDVTAYREWQNARLAESGLLEHPRVGVFSLWTAQTRAGETAINQVFVHSKVVVCDDRWALVGSANLDGASLSSYGDDFSGRLARRVFRDVRNFDVSLELTATNTAPGAGNPVLALRKRLWSEHLTNGSLGSLPARECSPVAAWRAVARENVALLNGLGSTEARGLRNTFILAYSTKASPVAQLQSSGVALGRAATRIEFNPNWVERNWSLNWFRNMFG